MSFRKFRRKNPLGETLQWVRTEHPAEHYAQRTSWRAANRDGLRPETASPTRKTHTEKVSEEKEGEMTDANIPLRPGRGV